MAEGKDNIIKLINEKGREEKFELLDVIEYDGRVFLVLFSVEEEDDDEVIILELEDTDDLEQETYVTVENEDILKKVFEIFKEKHKDDFIFKDN